MPHRDHRKRRIAAALVILLAVLAWTTVGAAEDAGLTKLAERLADLRGEVDELAADVEARKRETESRVQSLRRQRADIEMQIQRQQGRLQQLRQTWKEHKRKAEARRERHSDLEPVFAAALGTVRQTVEAGPPFKRKERLAELEKLQGQVADGTLAAPKGVSRLWQFVEDELRLAGEMGVYEQVVELDGRERLVDVARIGMVGLFFKTDDGQMGMARRPETGGDGTWGWTTVDGEKRTRRIRQLFESFRKGVRTGYFELPNAVRGIERRTGGEQ